MNIFCEEPCVVCQPVPEGLDGIVPNPNAEGNPFSNFSSEAPDRVLFFARNYRALPDDPFLGTGWRATGCVGLCFSSVSQEDADLCAARQQVLCTSDDWPNLIPNPDPNGDPFIPAPRPVFLNDAQYCGYPCPDGSVFYFTVIAGLFSGFSQLEANLLAYNHARYGACRKAFENHICIGSLSRTSGCLGETFSTQVSISSKVGTAPVSFEIVSGSLPPGLSPSQNFRTAFFTGTPESVGSFTFMLRATDTDAGIFNMEKQFTINIISIAEEILPDGLQDEEYSETLTTYGPIVGTATWSILSGSLPAGITISAGGVISGTPTTVGEYEFTVGLANGGSTCSKLLSILVDPAICFFNPSPTGCGEIGVPFSTTLVPGFDRIEGFQFQFSIVSGTLPTGLSLNGNTGVISGTPSANGTFVYTVQLVNGPITCTKEFSCSITSSLCTNASDVGSWSVTFESPTDIGVDTSFTMVGFNGSYHANAKTINPGQNQCHVYEINLSANVTNNTGTMCFVRATANYSYEVVDPRPVCLSQDSAVTVDILVNGVPGFPGFVPLVLHGNPPGGSGSSGEGLEVSNVFGLPPGVNVVKLRVAVRGTRCGSTSCVPSFITGTLTLEPLPP